MTLGMLLIAPLLLAAAGLLVRQSCRARLRALVAESFAVQQVELDGRPVAAATLDVIHRWPLSGGMDLYSRPWPDETAGFAVNWLCRTADRGYLLAIAQGRRGVDGKISIDWVWRRLTEERARHSLVGDRRAYRAAFGDP